MNSVQINQYLWCGYPPPDKFPTWLSDCITPDVTGKGYSPREVASRFDTLFDALARQISSGHHIIPLSGGWDRRAILGVLLERVDLDQIVTVTFGVLGQLNYDLGKMVADSIGVEHHAFDLKTVDFTWDAIRESVAASSWIYVPDSHFNSLTRNRFSSSSDAIWSGFLGETPAGSHLLNLPVILHEQIVGFSSKQRRGKMYQLCSPDFSFADAFPHPDQNISITYDDALDLGIRRNAIAPIVLLLQTWENWRSIIGKERSGAKVIAPFADRAWAGYWLSAPRKVCKGQKLYLEMLNLKFPELFSLLGKANYGTRWDRGVRSMLRKGNHFSRSQVQRRAPWLGIKSSLMANYLDYDEMFRNWERIIKQCFGLRLSI